VNIAILLQGGVDRTQEYRVIPVLLGLIGQLATRHTVDVFAMCQEPRPGQWALRGAQIHNIGSTHAVHRAVNCLWRAHRRRRFDIIHALWTGPSGLAAAIASRLTGVPLTVHLTGGELVALHDVQYGQLLRRRWRLLNPWILRTAARITATSDPMVAMAASAGFVATRVPLGVDLVDWPEREPQRRDVNTPLRVIQVASLNRVKDHATTIEALRQLRDRGRAVEADFVGEDTLGGAVQESARKAGIEDRARFHGFLTQRNLRPLFERAHVHVVSSLHEAGPAAALEAALLGVPTVGTCVGHLQEWAPEAAMTVAPRDAAGLADGIDRLSMDEELRLRIGRAAQARALAEHAGHTASRFERIYGEIARAR
jgi:glycosyltransferase involved in cell wall biosynthesis